MKAKGFTPVLDEIRDDVGGTAAFIYGVMWRYSRMSELRICTASHTKIAERAGLKSRETVIKHQNVLVNAGYITEVGRAGGGTISWACNVELKGEVKWEVSKKPTGGVEKTDSPTIKKVIKKEQPDFLNAFYGTKPPKVDSTWFPPDVMHYLREFSINFKIRFKREATKQERGYWIRECREWLKRGYSVDNVQNAWQHCVDSDTIISSPRSITWAFDQLSVDDEFYSKEM